MQTPVYTALTLNSDRSIRDGSYTALADAIRRGADLRIATAFRHNEHIDPASTSTETVEEVAEFRETCLLDDRWTAAFMTLRVPVDIPVGFGPRPSISLFLYNQNGEQAIARPYLDGAPVSGDFGAGPLDDHSAMPRYHQHDSWDAATNAPSSNFIYDFDSYRFLVNDRWRELLSHAADGSVVAGSVTELADAFGRGLPVKLGIRGLWADLTPPGESVLEHEVFIHAGSCYYYTEQKLFMTGTHPLVRVRSAIPLRYASRNWDFGWLMARSDGQVARWLCDPYTLTFQRSQARCAMRWFVAEG